jgi:phytoene desaturase
MTLIQHLEGHYGTFVPTKGMVSITESLYRLALKLGVEFSFNSKVEEIIIDSARIQGVQTSLGFQSADLVVSNMDIFPTYKKLLPHSKPPTKILNQERSSSAVIFYWGIQKAFDQLELHNIFFSDDYKREFDAIFKEQTVCNDPTIYINITSKDVPTDAPKGCENWFVMINTPADHGQDWDSLVSRLRKQILKKLSKELKTPIEPLIACEEILTPPLIQEKTQSHLGALYGASSNNPMAAFLRHPNFSNRIKNLYFCGGSVHPGGGIPLCLLSAKIVDELIPKAS